MSVLKIALAKGRLAKQAMSLFKQVGIECPELFSDTRKLILYNQDKSIAFFLVKAGDVPTYVDYGAADIGIVGKDSLLEEQRHLYEVLDLQFGKCRMVVAGPEEMTEDQFKNPSIRVGTKYPQIAKTFFHHQKNHKVEIIKLTGSVELAPIVGLSELIVDIVETGTTLKENNLVIMETITDLSARMVVNRVSMKMKQQPIEKLINDLTDVLAKSSNKKE